MPVEEVIVRPLSDVAVAAPNDGVVNDGETARTTEPVPVVLVSEMLIVPAPVIGLPVTVKSAEPVTPTLVTVPAAFCQIASKSLLLALKRT